MRTLNLPIARDHYDRQEEQVFRERIRRAIEDSIGKTDLPAYPGVPSLVLSGTNAAWAAPTGVTPTIVPFNTVLWNTSAMVPDGAGRVTVAYTGVYMGFLTLHYNGTGANKEIDLYFCIFKNGVELLRSINQRYLNKAWSIESSFPGMPVAGDIIDIRLQHTETVTISFDLTKSRFTFLRLTPNPAYVDRTRV